MNLRSLEPIKPSIDWQETLKRQGVDFSVPPRITHIPNIRPTKDRITQIAIEDDRIRTLIAGRLSTAIRNNENWAVIYSDVDNLKKANTIERKFGDEVIRYGTATIAQAVDKSLPSNAEIIATRQTHAADETVIWAFGVSDEDLTKLEQELTLADNPRTLEEPKFVLSTSSSLIASSNPRVQVNTMDAKTWLVKDNRNVAFNFYQTVVELATADVGRQKIAKDLSRLPAEELLTADGNIDKFIDIMTENLGDSRISKSLLKTICQLTALMERISQSSQSENTALIGKFRYILEQFASKDINVRQASPQQLEQLWKEMFGTTKE